MITYPLNDIEYAAEDAELYACTRSSGVFSGDDFLVTCTGDNNNVTVGMGVGWIHNTRFSGKVFAQKAPETLDLGIADSTNPRIDVVAIRFDASANSTSLVVKNGTAAAEPVMPDIVQTESIYELYLVSVYREAGAVAVTQDNITDIRLDESVCGIMRDGVTGISTEGLQLQYYAVLQELRAALDRVRQVGTSAEFIPISDSTAAALNIASGSSVDNALNKLAVSFGAEDLGAGVSELETGKLYFVYE